MIKQKKKICLGCNTPQYIFSWGKCKTCYNKEYKKPIKKYSEKGVEKRKEKVERTKALHNFFLEIWQERKHNCQSCGVYLGNEAKSIYFDHLIEKSKRRDLAFEKDNILLVCSNCHSVKTIGFPTAKHLEYINKIKEKYGSR